MYHRSISLRAHLDAHRGFGLMVRITVPNQAAPFISGRYRSVRGFVRV